MPRLVRHPIPVLFLSLFAAQAGFLVLAPILPAVAHDLGVSTAAAGQLRTVSGLAGGITAIALTFLGGGAGPRRLLALGLLCMAGASIASALAPSFAVLALAQVPLGVAFSLLLSSGVAAVADWAPPEQRARVLAWTLNGQPAAWVAGMPVIGLVSDLGWRWAWIAVPLAASALALVCVAARPADPPQAPPERGGRMAADPAVVRWAIGELLASAAWFGTLVFVGALLLDAYPVSPALVGLLLGIAAAAYIPGTLVMRRWVDGHARTLLVVLGTTLAVGVATFGFVRPSVWGSTALFAVLLFLQGGRMLAGSALGLQVASGRNVAIMGVRTAAAQFGGLAGVGLGGVALAWGGFGALGLLLGGLFALAVVPHLHGLRAAGATLPGWAWTAPGSRLAFGSRAASGRS
jgi:predicted MFS family arabinose efflux permease